MSLPRTLPTTDGLMANDADEKELPPELMALSPQRCAFVLEYLQNGFNATRAAISARYSPQTACSQASDLLRIPKVQAAVRAGFRKYGVTVEGVLTRVAEIALGSDMADFADLVENPVGEGGQKLGLAELRRGGVNTRLIRRYRQGTARDGTVTREVELLDPQRAQDQLLRVLNVVSETDQVHGPVVTTDFAETVRARMAAGMYRQFHPELPSLAESLAAHGIMPETPAGTSTPAGPTGEDEHVPQE